VRNFSFLARLIEPEGATNQACQPLMVVALVIRTKTGDSSPARSAAGQGRKAGLLHINGIVAKLVLAPPDKPRLGLASRGAKAESACLNHGFAGAAAVHVQCLVHQVKTAGFSPGP
jgi:hypothetical protein